MANAYRIGLTRDFLNPEGRLTYKDIGLRLLEAHPSVQYRFFDKHEPTVTAAQTSAFDAIISLAPKYTRESFAGVSRLAAIFRFGVGYDMVDLKACTDADVACFITVGAVNYSVAEATITWMLALSHHVFCKDRLLREGRWAERSNHMGGELRGKTLGVVGLGGIGSTLVQLLRNFGMNRPLAFDPFVKPERAKELGVDLVPLDHLLREADFVSVNCPLSDQTRNLITKTQLAWMKPGAYLINTARGGIVNEADLIEVLKKRGIAGAATDVFEKEPAGKDHPFTKLDNVILAPHCIAWTDEMFTGIGTMACRQALAFACGEMPSGLVNRDVAEKPSFQKKRDEIRRRFAN